MQEQDAALAALAALAAEIPDDRRRTLEEQLPFASNPRFDAGVAAGLARALQLVQAEQGGQAAGRLQEIAAVAAAYALREQRVYAEWRTKSSTPEVRAEIDAEVARIEKGEPLFPLGELIAELDALHRVGNGGGPNKVK
jgi:hypothetical protein